jgi:hypothetical protein
MYPDCHEMLWMRIIDFESGMAMETGGIPD